MTMPDEPMTFAAAMACKPAKFKDLSDESWYVVHVATYACNLEGLECGDFLFNIQNPNPEIIEFFKRQAPPHEAAIELFQVRH